MSAKMLAPTIAELNGWVDREKLEGITGRSRDRQLEMVREIGLEDFESPGGGCLLTDANFAKKMFDFIKYDKFEVRDIPLMKFGRHLRLAAVAAHHLPAAVLAALLQLAGTMQ